VFLLVIPGVEHDCDHEQEHEIEKWSFAMREVSRCKNDARFASVADNYNDDIRRISPAP
jgi:hypothetical protein